MPLISVIIPVYNAGSTIKRCIDSIVSNNTEIEIVCVDDGSKDDSLYILNEISKKDSRLKVYHQENAGAGEARNKGLSLASGKYIMFCDSDDTFLPETIKYIEEDIQNYAPDYIVFKRKTVTPNGSSFEWGKGSDVTILNCTWYDYFNTILETKGHCVVVGNKVFKKEIITNKSVSFPKFTFGEDLWFLLTYVMNSKIYIEDYRAEYQQYQTVGSICLKSYKNYLDLNLECVTAFEKRYMKESNFIKTYLLNYKYKTLKRAIYRILDGTDSNSFNEKVQLTHEIFQRVDMRDIVREIYESDECSLNEEKNCRDILDDNFLSYYLRLYFLPNFKNGLHKILHI